jgi:hypothetical protein
MGRGAGPGAKAREPEQNLQVLCPVAGTTVSPLLGSCYRGLCLSPQQCVYVFYQVKHVNLSVFLDPKRTEAGRIPLFPD